MLGKNKPDSSCALTYLTSCGMWWWWWCSRTFSKLKQPISRRCMPIKERITANHPDHISHTPPTSGTSTQGHAPRERNPACCCSLNLALSLSIVILSLRVQQRSTLLYHPTLIHQQQLRQQFHQISSFAITASRSA
jgi:hypothetical protein